MSGERPVTGFAGDMGMSAAGADLAFVFMAQNASALSGVGSRMLADGSERAGAVMAILAECLGHDGAANHHEYTQSGQQHDCRPDEVPRITEELAHSNPTTRILSLGCSN